MTNLTPSILNGIIYHLMRALCLCVRVLFICVPITLRERTKNYVLIIQFYSLKSSLQPLPEPSHMYNRMRKLHVIRAQRI